MKQGIIYIAVATVFFSLMEVVLKTISGVFNPVQLTFTRFLIGGLVLLPIAIQSLKKKHIRMKPKDFVPFIWIGFIGVVVSMTFYQIAVSYTEASVVAVLFSSNPLFVMLFAFLLIREPISKYNVAGLALDIIGIVFVINPWQLQINPLGIIFTLISTLLFALYGVSGKKQGQKVGGVVNTCFGFLFGSVEMIILAFLTHIPAVSVALKNAGLTQFASIPFFSGYSTDVLLPFLFVCVGVTGIGYACYFMAMQKTSANTASLVFFFKPILAPLMALLFLGEAIPAVRIIGIVFILGGSLTNMVPAMIKAKRKGLRMSNS